MEAKFQVIDLFSGSGGSALGFAQAGFNIAAAVDIDTIASKTFKRNFPQSVVLNTDIRSVKGNNLLKTAGIKSSNRLIIIACPPCQGFSNARRKSQAMTDPRNNLVYEFIRLVEEINPVAFVMENVPGLAKGVGKEAFALILRKLDAMKYRVIYDVIDCADYGIPQRRKRLVMIGTKNSELRLIFPHKSNQDPNLPDAYLRPWKTVRETISNLPKISAGEINTSDTLHASANLSDTNLKRLRKTPHDGGDRTKWPDELKLACHIKTDGFKDVYGRMRWDTPSPTITGGCAMISKGRFGHPEQDRAISLREAARLQSFPNSFAFTGNFGEIAKQIGNAVPPLLAKRIADSLLESLNELSVSLKVLNSFSSLPQEKNIISEGVYQVA